MKRTSAFIWVLMQKKKPVISNADRFFCFNNNVSNLYNNSLVEKTNGMAFNPTQTLKLNYQFIYHQSSVHLKKCQVLKVIKYISVCWIWWTFYKRTNWESRENISNMDHEFFFFCHLTELISCKHISRIYAWVFVFLLTIQIAGNCNCFVWERV